MEISFSSNSITDDHIATKVGTCHDSPAVVPCAKYCSDHFISIWMRAKWNFHHIWIVMEKLLVKWAPGPYSKTGISFKIYHVNDAISRMTITSEFSLYMTWVYFPRTLLALCPCRPSVVIVRNYNFGQQAISWATAKPALCRHMAWLGHNGLMYKSE